MENNMDTTTLDKTKKSIQNYCKTLQQLWPTQQHTIKIDTTFSGKMWADLVMNWVHEVVPTMTMI
jgi:hypothetical protein